MLWAESSALSASFFMASRQRHPRAATRAHGTAVETFTARPRPPSPEV